MTHFNGSCDTCKFCDGNVRDSSGRCKAVKDPLTGKPMPVCFARMDTYNGYKLPCGYQGALWVAKDGGG